MLDKLNGANEESEFKGSLLESESTMKSSMLFDSSSELLRRFLSFVFTGCAIYFDLIEASSEKSDRYSIVSKTYFDGGVLCSLLRDVT